MGAEYVTSAHPLCLMEKLALLESALWIGIAIAAIIGLVLLVKFISNTLNSGSKTNEANPNADQSVATASALKLADPTLSDSERASALNQFFDTAKDPNPQGFFARLWSLF